MSDSITLNKFSGLLRSGVPMEKALKFVGGIPLDNLGLHYLLRVAMHSGASVANQIDAVAELCYQAEHSLDRIRVAYAGPKSSSTLVIWLPVITLLIAQLAGFDLLATISARPIVLVSIGLGTLLLVLAKLVSRSLIRKASPTQSFCGYYLMGVSLEAGGGATLNQAQRSAYEIYEEVFSTPPSTKDQLAMAEISNLVELTGARAGDLLKANALNLQREISVANEIRIERLGVKLMLPLGLAVLPAFICLAVIPLLATLFGPN
jgi:tight adherence protein B